MRRGARLFVAWGAGWAVYMVAMLLWAYDGIASMILQPLAAAVVSACSVGAVLLVGLVLRVPLIGRFWNSRRDWATTLVMLCLAVMCLGSRIGLTATYADPETGRTFVALHPAAALATYFVLLFTLANWPEGQSKRLVGCQDL